LALAWNVGKLNLQVRNRIARNLRDIGASCRLAKRRLDPRQGKENDEEFGIEAGGVRAKNVERRGGDYRGVGCLKPRNGIPLPSRLEKNIANFKKCLPPARQFLNLYGSVEMDKSFVPEIARLNNRKDPIRLVVDRAAKRGARKNAHYVGKLHFLSVKSPWRQNIMAMIRPRREDVVNIGVAKACLHKFLAERLMPISAHSLPYLPSSTIMALLGTAGLGWAWHG